MTRTARVWLLGLASACAVGCTVYEPALLPDTGGKLDAAVGDVVTDHPREARGDAADGSAWPADRYDAAEGERDEDSAADGWGHELADVVDDAPIDAAPIDAAPICDAGCLQRCADRVMNGSETRIDCGGDCPPEMCPPAPSISNLAVNDINMGQDGINNNLQWTIGASFAEGQPVFGDRPYTVTSLPPEAMHLLGKPWIRTAADSKLYSGSTPPVATATISGSFIYLLMDERQTQQPLMNDDYFYQSYRFDLAESDAVRHYGVWRKAIVTSPATVAFPSVSSVASFYMIVVE